MSLAPHLLKALCSLVVFAASLATPLGGPKSPYTTWLTSVAVKRKHGPITDDIKIACIQTPPNIRYVGARELTLIDAPLAEVVKVIDDFDRYIDLSPGFEEIRVVSREGGVTTVHWRKDIPFFFVPDLVYDTSYVKQTYSADRVGYRYQLKRAGALRAADGLILLETERGILGKRRTRFIRYDFIDPTGGVFKNAPVGRVWRSTLEDLFISTAGMKLRAEHPDWSYEHVTREARALLESQRDRISDMPSDCDQL